MKLDEDHTHHQKLSMMLDTQKVGYRHASVVQHSKISRYCASVVYQFLLHSKNQAQCLVHEPQGLVMAALELSYLHFLLTYPLYRFTETILSYFTPLG